MKRIVNTSSRPYRSPLREGQAQETRDRILEATRRVFARGLGDVSIPAIAREAGVSIPTVYRYFPTKKDLFEAIYPYIQRRAGVRFTPPTSIEDFRDGVREVFNLVESWEDLDRAAAASPAGEEVRHLNMDRRQAFARRIADIIAPALSDTERERLSRLIIVLTQSAAVRMWREHLGLSIDEAVDDVDWIVRSVIAGATVRQR